MDIDSETPAPLREKLVQDFKNGDLDVIVNVDIFSEGFDCPDLEFVQLARPTHSLVKYIQQVGRGFRKNGDKQCVILDNVGMYGRFGLPDDDRPWSDYFEGNLSSSELENNHQSVREIIRLGNPRVEDLSEGSDEMILIQTVDTDTNVGQNNIHIEEDGRPLDSIRNFEVCSSTIFSKYNVIENNDGYFLENIKTKERQFLCGLISRKSITIKLMKSDNEYKEFSIISSFNRDSRPTVNDFVIGYLYREGRLTRFATYDRRTIVDIAV